MPVQVLFKNRRAGASELKLNDHRGGAAPYIGVLS